MPDPTSPTSPTTPEPPAAPPPAAPPASSEPTAPTRPEGLSDRFWDAAKGVKTDDLIAFAKDAEAKDAAAAKAEADRKATLPAKADDYKIEVAGLADMMKAAGLEGQEGVWDPANPAVTAFKEHAFANGWGQAQVDGALKLYAQAKIAEATRQAEADKAFRAAETAKLPDFETRVKGVVDWTNRFIGADKANALLAGVRTAAGVQALEALQKAFSDQGLKAPPGNGQSQDDPNRLTREQADKMTPLELLNWQRAHERKVA